MLKSISIPVSRTSVKADLHQVSKHTVVLIQQFIGLLYQSEYIRNRDITYYASQLCITTHYLSKICKKVSGEPAIYWIDRFLIQEISRLLKGFAAKRDC